ncbi:MAG TPA: hypothetical protein VGS28_04405 [Candidatus Saccharimonadales bacterium]|nr:hypothetical protein [Candidatus Saccharimonadales bacterium]
MQTSLDPKDFQTFVYKSFQFDDGCHSLQLHYALEGSGQRLNFTESIGIPSEDGPFVSDKSIWDGADRLGRLLFIACGLSYFNLAAPRNVRVEVPISGVENQFLTTLFSKGLTEFAYSNNLPNALHPTIEASQRIDPKPVKLANVLKKSDTPVVMIGGGKDSIVTIESLRSSGHDKQLLFSVNTFAPMQRTAEVASFPYIHAKRTLSPNLFELDETQLYKRRHVPVTIIVSLVGVLTGILNGHSTVILSNERSASVGNVTWEGVEVNHQWAKSLEAEKLLTDTLKQVVSLDISCFSLLRPLSELRIARQFAKLTQYHAVFTSCNRSFRLDPSQRFHDWCDNCDKCRFVFLALAPYLSKEELLGIFGKDLLADPSQLRGYQELLGIVGHKPLECVGELEETRLALELAKKTGNWDNVATFNQLLKDLPESVMPTKTQVAEVFETSSSHLIPGQFQGALDEIE